MGGTWGAQRTWGHPGGCKRHGNTRDRGMWKPQGRVRRHLGDTEGRGGAHGGPGDTRGDTGDVGSTQGTWGHTGGHGDTQRPWGHVGTWGRGDPRGHGDTRGPRWAGPGTGGAACGRGRLRTRCRRGSGGRVTRAGHGGWGGARPLRNAMGGGQNLVLGGGRGHARQRAGPGSGTRGRLWRPAALGGGGAAWYWEHWEYWKRGGGETGAGSTGRWVLVALGAGCEVLEPGFRVLGVLGAREMGAGRAGC